MTTRAGPRASDGPGDPGVVEGADGRGRSAPMRARVMLGVRSSSGPAVVSGSANCESAGWGGVGEDRAVGDAGVKYHSNQRPPESASLWRRRSPHGRSQPGGLRGVGCCAARLGRHMGLRPPPDRRPGPRLLRPGHRSREPPCAPGPKGRGPFRSASRRGRRLAGRRWHHEGARRSGPASRTATASARHSRRPTRPHSPVVLAQRQGARLAIHRQGFSHR